MSRILCWAAAVLLISPALAAAYSVKEVAAESPKTLNEAVRKQLGDRAVQVLDDKNNVVCQIWLAREVPAQATPEQVKNGLTYRELKETALLGAVQIGEQMLDYRKQKIKPGVFTMRLAFQPQDGDHMGTAAHPEFVVLLRAEDDKAPATLEPKALHEQSMKAAGTAHPAVFLLFPAAKAADAAKLVDKGEGHMALTLKIEATVDGKKVPMGLTLNLFGVSPAA
jgi:hypothetical protein